MSVKYYLSLARFPDNNELSTDYDITRVAEDVTYSDASSSSVVYCAPVNGREIMWRGFICTVFIFQANPLQTLRVDEHKSLSDVI